MWGRRGRAKPHRLYWEYNIFLPHVCMVVFCMLLGDFNVVGKCTLHNYVNDTGLSNDSTPTWGYMYSINTMQKVWHLSPAGKQW